LKQALLGLLANMLRYGRPDATVTLTWQQSGPERIRLAVNDPGLTVPAGKLEQLFNPFERLSAEPADVEGSGIGLALSRRLVQCMGGSAGADCRPGEGTTFWIELPAVPAPAQPDRFEQFFAAGLAAAAEAVSRAQNPVVLSIESDPAGVRLVERILANRPQLRLVTALEGAAGLELARLHRPLVILVDANLPDMDAGEVLRRLKAEQRTPAGILVALSEDPTPLQEERLRAAGAQKYLSKPIDVQRCLGILDEALDRLPTPASVA
jgi:CheY-like chemotaxis protein